MPSTVPPSNTPGPDEIPHWILRHSCQHIHSHLLDLINLSWRIHRLPHQWRTAFVIPIPKPGRPPADPKSYRPITLLNQTKLTERLVFSRLNHLAITDHWISPNQSGFRNSHSTINPLSIFTQSIHTAFTKRRTTVAVFLDFRRPSTPSGTMASY